MPISCEAGESVDEVFDKIAGMIVTNLQTPRWILKIDDEFNGRGHAHFDVAYLRTHRKLSKMPGSDQMTEAELQRAKADVSEELRTAISKRVTITNKTVYRNWREYVEALVETGGVIEACPAVRRTTARLSSATPPPHAPRFCEGDRELWKLMSLCC